VEKVLVSACLMGRPVRYDGRQCVSDDPVWQRLRRSAELVAFCPEVEGGLSVPRPAAEIVGLNAGRGVLDGSATVETRDGRDVTEAFLKGAHLCLELVRREKIRFALLKARSPSCGSTDIYDGSFTKKKRVGAGVTTALLRENGVRVFDEDDVEALLACLEDS
jgi:uncharacterized protein YbbK (DUF523 family)